MGKSPHGPMLRQVFLKVQFWAHCSFLSILMTYQKVPYQMLNCLVTTSLFYTIHDSSTTRNELNDDLVKTNNWAYQWKMSFNPDPNKQVQEVFFSRKTKKIILLF